MLEIVSQDYISVYSQFLFLQVKSKCSCQEEVLRNQKVLMEQLQELLRIQRTPDNPTVLLGAWSLKSMDDLLRFDKLCEVSFFIILIFYVVLLYNHLTLNSIM